MTSKEMNAIAEATIAVVKQIKTQTDARLTMLEAEINLLKMRFTTVETQPAKRSFTSRQSAFEALDTDDLIQ